MQRQELEGLIGSRLAHYEITGHLGSGGMGDVYQATDSKLGRSVAIKLLPDAVAQDAERVARFEREARVLAALNHSSIAAIHGLEESGGRRFLVMELVPGETLAERIRRGPIAVHEALEIARQIAEALEAAHESEKGIIHRDLKPANVKITPEGKVKVLDFGLAKAYHAEPAQAHLSNSPTMLSVAATGAGAILGTAAYMSPEQAKGRPVDRRTDVFAFGCVLFEMLSGRAAFEGEDLTEILGRVVTAEPDWRRLPAATPWLIDRLLRRALKKDPRQRLSDIRDARLDIEEALSAPAAMPAAQAKNISRVWPASLAGMAFVAVLLAIPAVRHLRESPPPEPREIRLELTTPATTQPESIAVSPDGQKIVFVATYEGRPALWVRTLDSGSMRALPGTEGASLPFWSPDSRSLGFFADAKLKRIDIDGGTLRVLANASFGQGGTWNADDVILFSPVPGRPILRVSANGGSSVPVTRIERSQEVGHGNPHFLPDGRHFLYSLASGDIYVGQLDRTESRRLIEGATMPMYVKPGYLLFDRQGTVFAQRFDAGRLELQGNPLRVVEQVAWGGGRAIAVSEAGLIVYRSSARERFTQFVWFDRSGKEAGRVGSAPDTAEFALMPSISPDGSRLALTRSVAGNGDVWLLDVARGVVNRFTSDAANDVFPVWSPDGARVAFASTRKGGVHNLFGKAANGAGAEELLLESTEDKMTTDWSPDGRHILYFTFDRATGNNIWALPLDGGRKPFSVVQTDFEERNAQFSPDGKWIAYQSNESGRFEVYVQPFPGPGSKTLISTNGGAEARWRRDGKELLYMALDGRLMAVPIRLPATGDTVEAGVPVPLFLTHVPRAVEHIDGPQYVVSPDGQRFLVNTLIESGDMPPITVILNWKPPPD
jgi:serine/threonine protein kinase